MSDDPIRVTIDRYDAEPEALREALRDQDHDCDLIVHSGEWVVFGPALVPDDVRAAVDQWATDTGAIVVTDPDDELRDAIEAATSLDDLKAALVGANQPARAAARRP